MVPYEKRDGDLNGYVSSLSKLPGCSSRMVLPTCRNVKLL
ncbi:hypothetical protein PI125_g662 [Phytophthora idaei]|nr:hypothetical protein PI125_g662 [Phytophthora idaei]